jgi:hypothetical protein
MEERDMIEKVTKADVEKEQEEYQAREGIVEVSKTVFGKETIQEQRIPIRPFITNPATVSVKAGATISLGPKTYEFARIDVFLAIPCYKEEVDDVYVRVKDWVDKRMAKEYKELKKDAV